MSAAYPNLRHAQYSGALSVIGRRRDVTWGRFRFAPPELVNPQLPLDLQPFRAPPREPSPGRRSAGAT